LIDNFIRHFGDWWLIGTHDYVNWGWDMWDRANQYVNEGESGGLIAFVCFVAMFCVCYRWIGNRRKALRGENAKEQLVWIIGAALFSQILAFVGVDYFDQSIVTWFLLLVIITVVAYLPMKETTLIQSSIAEEGAPRIQKPWVRENRVVGTHMPTRG
jgi:O-antigen ligase